MTDTNMVLNREFTKYSNYEAEQTAYELMQQSSFMVAEALMAQGKGTYAEIGGANWWVSPVRGVLEVVCSPDNPSADPNNCSVFMASCFDGQGVDDLERIKLELDAWLASPVFQTGNQSKMDEVVRFWYDNNNQSRDNNDTEINNDSSLANSGNGLGRVRNSPI